MYNRSQEDWRDDDLSDEEIDWIMKEEGNATTLLKRDPNPASGGPANWYIREGKFVTLAEIFWKGIHWVSAFDAYKTYESLPVLIHRRGHFDHSANASMKRKANWLRYVETGRFGVPSRFPALADSARR